MGENYIFRFLLCFASVFLMVKSAPLPQGKIPSKEMEQFMKRFGYLDSASNADTLYSEEGFKEAVLKMQKFGGVPQTGELDEATLNLTRAPRCGVPDVVEHPRRSRRYAIGSEAWKKKTITYILGNWPPEMDPEVTRTKLAAAFSLWSQVSPLRFQPHRDTNADLVVAFGRGPHGDGYPFDGPGNVLAHAFFPYEHGHFGGDIHFDDDENWIDGSTTDKEEGIDFYTVAAHEIGHSLGLAHSAVQDSIMFPYYKGYDSYMRLGYDDVYAMYSMYVLNANFEDDTNVAEVPTHPDSDDNPDQPTDDDSHKRDDDSHENDDDSHENGDDSYKHDDDSHKNDDDDDDSHENDDDSYEHDDDSHKHNDDSHKNDDDSHENDDDSYEHDDDSHKHDDDFHDREDDSNERDNDDEEGRSEERDEDRGTSHESDEKGEKSDESGESEGSIDKPSTDSNDIDVEKMPKSTTESPEVTKETLNLCDGSIDAASLFRGELFVFKGNLMWRLSDRDKRFAGYPLDFHAFFQQIPRSIRSIDAAYERPDNHIVVFTGQHYWVHHGNGFTKDSPRPLTDLGLPPELDKLDAAFVWAKNKKTYLFRRDQYWRYDDLTKKMDPGYPLNVTARWRGLQPEIDTAFTWKNGITYFFKGDSYVRFNNQNVSVDDGYPLPTRYYWFGCHLS